MAEYAGSTYPAESITGMEVLVLNRLEWSLTVVTPLHFLNYYLAKSVVFEDDTRHGRPLVEKVPKYIKKYVDFFAEICMQEYAFQAYTPSVLAGTPTRLRSACVCV